MVDDKQFIISKKRYTAEGFKNITLRSGFVLSYQDKLKVTVNKDCSVALLGYAWHVLEYAKQPHEFIKQCTDCGNVEEIILKQEEYWCGRYILIIGTKVYLDACGMLGLFYADSAVSSSFPIICRFLGRQIVQPDIIHGFGMDFVPGPLTPVLGINRLLPSQIYDVGDNTISERQLLNEYTDLNKLSTNELIDKIVDTFSTSLCNMRKEVAGNFYLALTGGHDSRTLMSLLEYTGIDYNTFIMEHDNICLDDITLSERLSKLFNRRHIYIRRIRSDYQKISEQNYIKHTGGMAQDEDLKFFSYGQYQKLSPNSVILRSGIWGSVIEYYRNIINDKIDINLLNHKFEGLQYDELCKKSILSYKRWGEEHPQKYINLCNTFFWEQREGAWLSSIEQSFDMMDNLVSLQPCNCRFLLGILLSFDIELRKEKKYQDLIIKKTCPELTAQPYANDMLKKNGKRKNMKVSIEKLIRVYRKYGLRNTTILYKNKLLRKVMG